MAASRAFLQATNSTSDLTTYTFASQNLGTASSDRHIAVVASGRRAVVTCAISTITVQGISATEARQQATFNTNSNVVGIYIAAVPTGTTGDVVVTFSGGMVRCGIALYALTGLSSATPHDTDASTNAAPMSMSIDCAAGGLILAASATAAGTTTSWSGVTEDFDAVVETTGLTYSGASDEFATTQTALAVSATVGSSVDPCAVCVAWSGAAPGGFQAAWARNANTVVMSGVG